MIRRPKNNSRDHKFATVFNMDASYTPEVWLYLHNSSYLPLIMS